MIFLFHFIYAQTRQNVTWQNIYFKAKAKLQLYAGRGEIPPLQLIVSDFTSYVTLHHKPAATACFTVQFSDISPKLQRIVTKFNNLGVDIFKSVMLQYLYSFDACR